ncbi:MAG: class A beta-lactamase-related serine hydrolase [Bacteroidia bacterium]|nr:class A beta-lactamase-related serine hydrolase [Bacteroidia bacterium]
MKAKFIWYAALYILLTACSDKVDIEDPILRALSSEDPRIKMVMENLDAHEVQILFTRIDRSGDSISLTDHTFQVDEEAYFYPASTVKFPIAVLALEYINELKELDLNTRFYVEGDTVETTVGAEVEKVFAVSDNAANNRLVELLGQDRINERLQKKGIQPVRIAHRLSASNADEVVTKPLIIYLNDSTTMSMESSTNAPPQDLQLKGILKGSGFIDEDTLIGEPFDFGQKNYYPISAQHATLKRVLFPELFDSSQRFELDDESWRLLLNAMKSRPRELGYDPEIYYDSYVKFFLFGDSEIPYPEHVEIYNKVGYAYGTLTDCAYILDVKNNVEFMLTATLLVNSNGVFNDNVYEYEKVGIPFLAALGQELYDLELHSKK